MAFSFGTPAAAPAAAAAPFAFGAPAAAPAPAPAAGGFTFGAPAAAAPAPAAAAGGTAPLFSFGAPATSAPAPAPAAGGGFTFGAAPAAAAPAPAAAAAAGTGFTFGAAAPAPAPAAAGASTGMFSFGATAATTTTAATTATATTATGAAGTPPPPPINVALLGAEVNNPGSAAHGVATFAHQLSTNFRWIFYNIKDPRASMHQYQKPPELTDQEWFQAKERNPDDRLLIPVPVLGFDGLIARVEQQDVAVKSFSENAQALLSRVKATELAAEQTTLTLQRLRHRRRHLSQRLLAVMEKVDRLMARGKPWQSTEMALRTTLGHMLAELNKPTEFHAKLAELQSLHRMQDDVRRDRKNAVSKEDLSHLFSCLEAQRKGIGHLCEFVRKDNRDLDIIMDAVAEHAASGAWGRSNVTKKKKKTGAGGLLALPAPYR